MDEALHKKSLLKQELDLREAMLELRRGLPHLYGPPWYSWAKEFFDCRNKMAFLTAGNQLSKSSTMIRTCIDWATDKKKWPELWPRNPNPNLFLYFYPTNAQATIEFETKWSQFLPRNGFEKHPDWGWKSEYKNREIHSITFNSGISIFFKSYKQGPEALQTATAFAIFLDEETPEALWDELSFRVAATEGYIRSAFTATLGQEMWRQAMEPANPGEEKFPHAWKRQVSAYDCLEYADGSATPWSEERINALIATCRSPQEVQRRVYGKFVKEEGLIYPQFSAARHMKQRDSIPKGWFWYVAADIGSGKIETAGQGHPGGIVIAAVRPDYQEARVIQCWRGDNQRTTAGDIYNKAEEMIRELDIHPMAKLYDWASADFGTISNRNGGGWRPANKSHELGEQALNTLFKNDMFTIDQKGENGKLAGEFSSVSHDTPKRKRRDDLIDPARYIAAEVPWDWTAIKGSFTAEGTPIEKKKKMTPDEQNIADRRGEMSDYAKQEDELEAEFDEINSLYAGQ